MKRITITIIVLLTVCCLLAGCTPNEENSAETYTLPALETGEQAEHPDPSAPEAPGTGPEDMDPGNTDQPPAGTTDSSEVHTVDNSEENLTPRDSDPIQEANDSSEDIPMTETPVQVPIDTEDPDMIVESDYVYEPSGNVGIGGN